MQTEGHDDDLKGFVEKCYVWSLVFGWQQGVNARWLRGALKFETGQRRRPKLVTEASSAYGQEQSPTFFFLLRGNKAQLAHELSCSRGSPARANNSLQG